MRFLSAEMENFCSIGKAKLDLCDQRLVVVNGKNMDGESSSSNGSGKSTYVVDSICWCLFGKTTKGGPAGAVTPKGKGKGTMVSLTFMLDDDTYILSRHRNHPIHASKAILTKNGEDISKATASDMETLIQDTIKVNFDTFLYTTILGQGMMFRFSQLTDQNRKEILESIAQTTIYESARVSARNAVRNHAEKVTSSIRVKGVHVNKLDSLQKQLDSTANQLAQSEEDDQRRLATYQKQVADAAAFVAASKASLGNIGSAPNQEVLIALQQVGASYRDANRTLREQLASAKTVALLAQKSVTALGGVGATCDHCGSNMSAEHMQEESAKRNSHLEQSSAAVQQIQAAVTESDGKLANIEREIYAVQQQQNEYAQRKYQAEESVRSTESQLRAIEANVPTSNSAGYVQMLEGIEAQMREEMSSLQTVDKEAVDEQAQQDIASQWVDGFQDIRVAAIDNLLEFLNQRLEHYGTILCGDDIKISLSHNDKGKIDLNVTTAGGSYLSASGGEKDRIDICIAFSLLALARQCTNWTSNILVLDEIAVFVDEAGIDRLMQLVDVMMDDIESLFLISHNPVFSGYGDSSITVVKEGGVSRVEQD